ncbi:MAG: hypothetical protein ACRDY7_11375 [Acidimicrobiia bacterium]
MTENDSRYSKAGIRDLLKAVSGDAKLHATPSVVVTGSADLLPDTVEALGAAGLGVMAADTEGSPAGVGAGTVRCYVQLPSGGPHAGGLAAGMMARFDAFERVAPLLASDAIVLLVGDPRPVRPRRGRPNGLDRVLVLLADAIERDHPGVTALVLDGSSSPAEVAAVAREETASPLPWSSYLRVGTDLPYAEWRDDVLALSS